MCYILTFIYTCMSNLLWWIIYQVFLLYSCDFIALGNDMTLRVTEKCFIIIFFYFSLAREIQEPKCCKAQSGHKGYQLAVSTIP